MSTLVVVEEHSTFDDASFRARELAIELNNETTVVRSHAGWNILASTFSRAVLATADRKTGPPATDDAFDEQYRQEVLVPLREEVSAEQDDWARSNEDGWFYEDEV